ncbi:hypothetical protein ElyMa_006058400 [Elysia marginata]|uniref:Uncharacterized protein n=1 Tax=Elysia marginata TaxID=1093978 RepID=A0AAV4GMG2_9GAST|nr:hypothetical protein ElyMa_006058400 [Elysia marginata]
MVSRMPLGECHLPAINGPKGNQGSIIDEPCVTKTPHSPEPLACTSMTFKNTDRAIGITSAGNNYQPWHFEIATFLWKHHSTNIKRIYFNGSTTNGSYPSVCNRPPKSHFATRLSKSTGFAMVT